MAFKGKDGRQLGKGLGALLQEMAVDQPVIASTVCAAQEGAVPGFEAKPVDVFIDLGADARAWGLVRPAWPYEVTSWSYSVDSIHPAELIAEMTGGSARFPDGLEHFYLNAGGMGYKYLRVHRDALAAAFTELGFDVSPRGLADRLAGVEAEQVARFREEQDAEEDELQAQIQLGQIVDSPCPTCGELGACGYDAEGRALIHAAYAEPED